MIDAVNIVKATGHSTSPTCTTIHIHPSPPLPPPVPHVILAKKVTSGVTTTRKKSILLFLFPAPAMCSESKHVFAVQRLKRDPDKM